MVKTFLSVREYYNKRISEGNIIADAAQFELVDHFDRLIGELGEKPCAKKLSTSNWLFARKSKNKSVIKGLYIHGEVGRGKTMLMDIFYELVPVNRKRRAHFNDFMADVHERIHTHRQAFKIGKIKQEDPIPSVADTFAEEALVLCFDEFSVTDITDAMILSRLFDMLFKRGVVLVATSNVVPDDLYRDGLNRELFLPFITLLKHYVEVIHLNAHSDYRLKKVSGQPVYISPLNTAASLQMDAAWEEVKGGAKEEGDNLIVKGHTVFISRAVPGAARFSFHDLCVKPLGTLDYLAIVGRYHTIFIDDVPVLDHSHRNEVKRFILLIDTFYDHHARIFMSAQTSPEKLYATQTGTEAFEFNRTVSRLFEMQSQDYLNSSNG